MELIVDDRERSVITYLEKIINIKIDRITVGDYAFVYNGKVLMVVERKSLSDLASSIKDGRMDNNEKLLEAQQKHGCKILYIIEGSAYPKLDKKIGRMPYACLQGKLDSLLFRHDIKIIWTKDCKHTAERLAGLCSKLFDIMKDTLVDSVGGVDDVIKPKHEININKVHLTMLTKLSGVSYKTASIALQKYTIIQLLTGQTNENDCFNLLYSSGSRMGTRGAKLHLSCKNINRPTQQKILSCINGITINTAESILAVVEFQSIVNITFKNGDIANIIKTEKRKVGKSIEDRIRQTFAHIDVSGNL